MKVCLIITGLKMGGAETQVCNLADQFVLKGHEVLLLCLTGDIINKPKSNKVIIHNLKMNKNIIGFVRAQLMARRIISDFSPDVVHSHMVHANIFSRLLRVICKMPRLVNTSHSSYEGSGMRILAYRLTDWLVNISTSVSKQAVNSSISRGAVPMGRMLVQYNGIDTSVFKRNMYKRNFTRQILNLNNNDVFILSVGRLTAAKDFKNLLEAMSKLQQYSIKLFIAGVGELEQELHQLVNSLDLENKVSFLGLRRDIPDLMNAADVFVLSSEWEGFPMVIGEAMSSECIVVSTDAGGSKEWFCDSLLKYVVSIKNSDALAKAILDVLSLSSEERTVIGQLSRKRILDFFCISKIADQWIEHYQ